MNSILDRLKTGEPARLISSVAESKKEERATSALLAVISIVPDFAKALLEEAGATVGKRAEVICYTEVVFRDVSRKLRPDGLIVVRNGSKTWSALIESKIGNSTLNQDQMDDYLKLCREVGADALITISNQFALRPHHHPLLIPRKHLKYVDVAHFSWLSIISRALLSISNNLVTDVEQAFLLRELIRFLEHESSGVSRSFRMGSAWTDVVSNVQINHRLTRSAEVEGAVAAWHQLMRYLSIRLTMETGRLAFPVLTRQRRRDADLNFMEDMNQLVQDHLLIAEFEVSGSVPRIQLKADFARRTVEVSSRLAAPGDRSRPVSSINWFVRQLRDNREVDPVVRVFWPRSPVFSTLKLSEIEAQGAEALVPESKKKTLPVAFEVAWIIDLASRFKGSSTFVDEVTGAVPRFFEVVSDRLKIWVPKRRSRSIDSTESLDEPVNDANRSHPVAAIDDRSVMLHPAIFPILPTAHRFYLAEKRH